MTSASYALRAAQILSAAPHWRLICHVKPDGDALGSTSALAWAGRQLGKTVEWGGADVLPPEFAFLPLADEYRVYQCLPKDDACLVFIDTSNRKRGIEGDDAPVALSIDHHADSDVQAAFNWVEPQAAAAGELIYQLLLALNCPPHAQAAEALYVALTTDSGDFRFSNTTPRTLAIASELVRAGAQPARIDQRLHFNDTLAKVRLWGRCLERVQQLGEHVIFSWVTMDDIKATGAQLTDTEGLVNMLTHTADLPVAVLLVETPTHLSCNFRSRGGFSARELAKIWNGGGHECAAGCRMRVPFQVGMERLLGTLPRV